MQTPLIEITNLGFANNNRVFAKYEHHNLIGNSHYDRVYKHLFDKLINEGKIIPGKTHLLETSSGNAGTVFAKYCKLYGFDGTIFFPSNVRKERVLATENDNVKIVISSGDDYISSARFNMLRTCLKMRKEGHNIYKVNHSQVWDSVQSMFPCGDEVVESCKGMGITLDYFITALGNGTTTSGIGIPLKKEFKSSLKIIGFEPSVSPTFTNLKSGKNLKEKHKASLLTGTGVWGIPFPNMKLELVDQIVLIDEADQVEIVKNMNHVGNNLDESIGLTSGASLLVVRQLAQKTSNKNFLVVFYDIREFYDL